NIYRHREKGKSAIQASYDGIREIGSTVISTKLVIAAVLVPIALTGCLISGSRKQFSITVAETSVCSHMGTFPWSPLMTYRFSKLEHLNKKSLFGRFIHGFEKFLDGFVKWLLGILNWAFGHKAITLIITFVLFISSFFLVSQGFIGSEFVNEGD